MVGVSSTRQLPDGPPPAVERPPTCSAVQPGSPPCVLALIHKLLLTHSAAAVALHHIHGLCAYRFPCALQYNCPALIVFLVLCDTGPRAGRRTDLLGGSHQAVSQEEAGSCRAVSAQAMQY